MAHTKDYIGEVSVENLVAGAILGKVGIDQTTPGTTNGVQVNAALPAGSNTIGAVTGPTISVATACSGQVQVTTAGTAVQGPNVAGTNGFYLKAHPSNTGVMWVGNDGAGDVSNANGFPLKPGETILIAVANLNVLWFDADVNLEKVAWVRA